MIAIWAVLAMALGSMVSPAEAQPFAYVADFSSSNVSVIDTASNTVVATIPVGSISIGAAVTPDGTHAYVTTQQAGVVVIDTATNTVVASIPVGISPLGSRWPRMGSTLMSRRYRPSRLCRVVFR
jgi:YVTN family beta-propeller protein